MKKKAKKAVGKAEHWTARKKKCLAEFEDANGRITQVQHAQADKTKTIEDLRKQLYDLRSFRTLLDEVEIRCPPWIESEDPEELARYFIHISDSYSRTSEELSQLKEALSLQTKRNEELINLLCRLKAKLGIPSDEVTPSSEIINKMSEYMDAIERPVLTLDQHVEKLVEDRLDAAVGRFQVFVNQRINEVLAKMKLA